jgi:glycosyltransferase involved in cell wall biosynthesis
MRRIIHLSTVHGRYDVRIFHKQCRSIAANGDDLTLVVQDGQGDESLDGFRIVDLGFPPAGRVMRIIFSPWRAYRALRRVPADIIHFHDPELLPIGFLLKKGKCHVIYDAHEDVPRDILSKHWIPAALRKLLAFLFEKLENGIARRLDAVVCATPFIARRFQPVNPNSIVVNNFPIAEEFQPENEARPFSRTVCYIGGITRVRGISELIEALGILRDVTLVMCGPFESKAYEEELMSLPGWKNVDYRGVVGRNEVSMIMAGSALGAVTFLPTPNHVNAQPNKMFEYMAAGLPLLASDFPLWQQIVAETQSGVCVDPSSPAAIAQAIAGLLSTEELCRAKGRAGRKAIENRFNWKGESKKLLKLYGEIK